MSDVAARSSIDNGSLVNLGQSFLIRRAPRESGHPVSRVLTILVLATACGVPSQSTSSKSEQPSSIGTSSSAAPTTPSTPTAIAATGSFQYRAEELFELQITPTAIAADSSHVYVAEVQLGARPTDTLSKVIVVSPAGGTPMVVSGSETPASVSINGLAISDDALYMSGASNGAMRLSGVSRLSSGTAAPVAGGPGGPSDLSHGNGDGGPALASALQGPASLAFSTAGDLYIAEAGDSRVRVVRSGTITTYAGGNGCGDINGLPTGTVATAKFCFVGLLAVDPAGVVYAAQFSRGKWIARIDPNGAVSTISSSFAVTGLAIDINGDLLAADGEAGRVLRFPRGHPEQSSVMASDLGHVVALATAPDGSAYVANWRNADPTIAVTYKITRLVRSP